MPHTQQNKDRIAAKLYNEGLTFLNYTTEKANEILARTATPEFCKSVLAEDEETILEYIKLYHLIDVIEDTLIGTVEDVKNFFLFLVKSEGLNLDIDLPFENYTTMGEFSTPTYDRDQANSLNEIMTACFAVCQDKGKDIYEIAVEAQRAALNF